MNILEVENVSKTFGEVKALNNVSLGVEKGAVLGLLGPNGAGKTTLLRIINNLLTIDQGSVRILGEPVSLGMTRHIGYMPEERGLYEKMRVEDQIMYFGQLKGGEKKRLREVMDEYISIFQIEQNRNRKVKELSKGNQQKVQIISTLVHEPELVILDEPFSGFDPINGALLQDLVARLREKGTTIILSSHNMPAVEEMCSSIALVNRGEILIHGGIEDIKEDNKTSRLLVTTRRPIDSRLLLDTGCIDNIENGKPHNWRKGNAYVITKRPGVSNTELLQALSWQAELLHFEEELPTLNEIFIRYTNPDFRKQVNGRPMSTSSDDTTGQPVACRATKDIN